MVVQISFLDKVHLQKYLFIVNSYLDNSITVSDFVEIFLDIRREDNYWLKSSFDVRVNKILDSMFLDIDEFTPPELFDPADKFNIDENELRQRLNTAVSALVALT